MSDSSFWWGQIRPQGTASRPKINWAKRRLRSSDQPPDRVGLCHIGLSGVSACAFFGMRPNSLPGSSCLKRKESSRYASTARYTSSVPGGSNEYSVTHPPAFPDYLPRGGIPVRLRIARLPRLSPMGATRNATAYTPYIVNLLAELSDPKLRMHQPQWRCLWTPRETLPGGRMTRS